MSDAASTAVVLSGGGAKGAYEVGVLLALATGQSPATDFQPLKADIFTGTSVGSYNATILAAELELGPAVAKLARIWREQIAGQFLQRCGNGVFEMRSGPLRFLDPGCALRPFETFAKAAGDGVFWANYAATRMGQLFTSEAPVPARVAELVDLAAAFSPAPLKDLLDETIDFEALATSGHKLAFAATNWKTGQLHLFDKENLLGEPGLPALQGSAALPMIFEPVQAGDLLLADGGIVMNTPLKPAIKLGATDLHVIFVDPFLDTVPLPPLPSTLDAFYRMYSIFLGTNTRQDIETANQVNQVLRLVKRGFSLRSRLLRAAAPAVRKLAAEVKAREDAGEPYEELVIHRYRPATDLGGAPGLLDFSHRHVDALIELGFQDAVAHDCAANGCSDTGRRRDEYDQLQARAGLA